MDRRAFIERTLLTTAAALTGSGAAAQALAEPAARKVGANDIIRVGVIGVRGRGRGHIGAFKKSPDAEVVAICDPDSAVIAPALESVPEARYYRDLRQMLDDPSIDAVSIATPNHWHALATIWALQAGKHVYVEKPLSHDLQEGRAVLEAERRYGRIRVTLAHGLCYKQRDSIGKVAAPTEPPPTMDFDLWTGPAALEPVMRANLHYDWHWDFNTGNGDIGNQGVHQMDIARWGLGLDDFPHSVRSIGGRVGYDDDGETPNAQFVLYDYGRKQILFEVRGLPTAPNHGAHIGVVFHGEDGYMVSSSYTKVIAFDLGGNVLREFTGGADHFQNFLDAVRSGNAADLNAPVLEGHRSTALCHLGNISHLLGETQRLSAIADPFGARDEANERFDAMRAHLVANGLDPAQTDCTVGAHLSFDDASQRFHGDRADEANALLTREMRAPYLIQG
jgi:predicted dehydrogenase